MGILKPSAGLYYDNLAPDYGSYQRLSLQEIIESFNATYVGKNKICEDVLINDITFHAIRGLQELSYDTLRSEKDWELIVPASLAIVLPIDYVNYVKLAWSDGAGVERVIYPTLKSSNPLDITTLPLGGGADGNDPAQFGDGFNTGGPTVDLTTDVSDTSDNNAGNYSDTLSSFQSQSISDLGSLDADEIDDWYGDIDGGRFGIDPQFAQANGSFFIDEDQGKIHFSSNLSGKTLVFKYLSDGLVDTGRPGTSIDLSMSYVHKFAEEAIYKHILYGCLLARKDTQPGLLAQLKKERFAETRKAKIRLSNLKSEELTQTLRGNSKQIKH
tara:strand:- start:579 stop:1562 length:984 start_codon:yes stop_codon:yes gene_type:complete